MTDVLEVKEDLKKDNEKEAEKVRAFLIHSALSFLRLWAAQMPWNWMVAVLQNCV